MMESSQYDSALRKIQKARRHKQSRINGIEITQDAPTSATPFSFEPNTSMDLGISTPTKGLLGGDLAQKFNDPKYSDFTIIASNEKFYVHKYILDARSPVFSAMFEHEELDENRKNEVKIDDIEPAVIKGMLEFIYTDTVKDFKVLVKGLLTAANKYDLIYLKNSCEETLATTINSENAAEILVLADLHSAHKLKRRAVQFIVSHLCDVVKTEGYKNLEEMYPLLLKDVLREVASRQESVRTRTTELRGLLRNQPQVDTSALSVAEDPVLH